MDNSDTKQKNEKAPRLKTLGHTQEKPRKRHQSYSGFIRSMRIALPLIALSIIAVLFSWNIFQPDEITPAKPDAETTQIIGKNELLNPKFDSIDDKNQPYTITADRALQRAEDELILLDAPMADITLNSGNWLAVKARQGAFRQETRHLILKGNVRLFHDDGYSAKTQELDINLKAGTARSDSPVTGHGALGTLNATGMHADSKAETLIFTGPAKLVLYETGDNPAQDILQP